MYESERIFQLWDYTVSHKQLLLRSPPEGQEDGNIDIVLWGVEVVSIPTIFKHIKIRRLSAQEVENNPAIRTEDRCASVFGIESIGTSGFIVASGCKILVNHLDLFDSSLVYVFRDRAIEEYGCVLEML